MENITAANKVNERQVETMVGKAMCAYANFVTAKEHGEHEFKYQPKEVVVESYRSEFEATVRCLEMFVNENIYAIQRVITARAKEEFGL